MLHKYPEFFSPFFSRADSTQAQTQDEDSDPYGYRPTPAVCILFLVLFGLSTFAHFCQAIAYRKWFFLYTAVFAGLIELAGWSGRFWSSQNLGNSDAFTIQIVCTIVAPTPLLAANFIILARTIQKVGSRYSRLSPRLYSRIFLSCDIVALFVQAGGGSVASGDDVSNTLLHIGTYTILGGIIFQLVIIICFLILATEFFWRYSRGRPLGTSQAFSTPVIFSSPMKHLIYAGMFNSACLLIRAIYRTIELADGFNGKVTHTQWLFDVFDATMIVLAMLTYNFVHPSRFLDGNVDEKPTGNGLSEYFPMDSSTTGTP